MVSKYIYLIQSFLSIPKIRESSEDFPRHFETIEIVDQLSKMLAQVGKCCIAAEGIDHQLLEQDDPIRLGVEKANLGRIVQVSTRE